MSIVQYLKYKEGILINRYLVVYFPLIVSVDRVLQVRSQEIIVSPTILYTIYVSTKNKRAHVYSLSCPLTCMSHGCS